MITKEMLETRIPNSNKEYIEKLNEEEMNLYLKMYETYSDFLYEYLIKILGIKVYDEMLENSKNTFVEVIKEQMDIYQLLGSKYLKFYYIRNNLYIERLDNLDKEFLKKKIDDRKYDMEVEKFIEKTYKLVISENTNSNKKFNINYGPSDHIQFYKPDNALVIGYRFNDYYQREDESEKEWIENNNKRQFELELKEMILTRKYENMLEIPICLQKYNIFSVRLADEKKDLN